MKYITNILSFFRITDEFDQMSLTNIMCLVAIWKVYAAPTLDGPTIAVLITAFSTYTGKKLIRKG